MKLPLHKWIKKLPDFPCVFVIRDKSKDGWEYNVYVFDWMDCGSEGVYLGWFNGIGDEIDSIQDMHLGEGEIMIIDKL